MCCRVRCVAGHMAMGHRVNSINAQTAHLTYIVATLESLDLSPDVRLMLLAAVKHPKRGGMCVGRSETRHFQYDPL